MKVRILVATIALLAAAALSAVPALASTTSTVTASIVSTNLTGARTLSAGPTSIAASGALITGNLPATVTETNVLGASPWSVTAQLTGPLTGGSYSIPASSVSDSTTAVTTSTSLLTGQSVTSGSVGTLDNSLTLYTVNGESTSNYYTNTFTSTTPVSLTLNGEPAGTYTGTIDLTLFY